MAEVTSKKASNLILDTLNDVKNLIEDVLSEARDGNDMFESASKLASLLNVWLRAEQLELNSEDLEKRVAAIELKFREQEIIR